MAEGWTAAGVKNERNRQGDGEIAVSRGLIYKQSNVELNEAAFLLGYEDANSFFRAFQMWDGTSPREWRERNRSSEVETSGH